MWCSKKYSVSLQKVKKKRYKGAESGNTLVKCSTQSHDEDLVVQTGFSPDFLLVFEPLTNIYSLLCVTQSYQELFLSFYKPITALVGLAEVTACHIYL